jgi:DNA-binding response OmpR family regulator
MSNRILVIDDDVAIVRCLKLRLERAGFQATSATDAFEGERLARQNPPDLILLDMRMPQRDGLATLVALRQAPETRDVSVLMLSGAADDGCRARAAGADGLLLKPCPADELLLAIRKLLERTVAVVPAS